MAIRGGPDIIEDGLVLHLDAAEPLCFRGEPTTNVVANPVPDANWFVANYGGSTVTRSYLIEDNIPFMRFSNVNVPTGGSYPRINNNSMTSTITGTFSASLEARGTEGAVVNFSIYSSGSTRVSFAVTLTSEWTRYEFTTTTAYNLDTPYFQPRQTGATYDIRNIQIEAKPYSTPFVAGTRGSTVATGGGLLDLTNNGNNGTITRAAVPSAAFYTSDNKGGFVFDGVNDYVALPLSDNLKNANYTISAFVKSNIDIQTGTSERYIYYFRGTTSGSDRFGILVGFSSNVGSNNGKLSLIIGNGGWNGYFSSKNFWSSNTWYHISVTQLGSAYKMYVNGDLTDSGTAVSPSFSGMDQNNFGLKWGGFQSYLSVYNRALTAAEIRQNYNATKGRFNL